VEPPASDGLSVVSDAGALQGSLTPAFLADDARGVVSTLGEARDQATQIAGDLEHLDAATAGLNRVRRLLGRLRDMTVVALDASLQPPQRAALQRHVDTMLGEIDTVADDTLVDTNVLDAGTPATAANGSDAPQLTPFKAISTATLGISGLGVRSADQALAAAGALDVATSRLQRSGSSVSRAVVRLQGALDRVTNPDTTATGGPALGDETEALTASMLLRARLLGNPDQAAQSQGRLQVSRVRRLLASPDD
jgi:flagellin-like hook-associated protein FlgL